MRNFLTHKYYPWIITGIGILVFFIAIFFYTFYDQPTARIVRVFIGLLYFGFFLGLKSKNVLFYLLFIFSILTNVSTIFYEQNSFAVLSMFFNLAIILVFLKAIYMKIDFTKKHFIYVAILVFVLTINGYIMFEFMEKIRGLTLSVLHYSLLLSMAYGSLILCFFTLWFNHKYSNRYSILTFLFIFSLIFSEIFRGLWYYEIAFGNISLAISIGLLIIGYTISIKLFLINTPVEEHLKLN